MVGMAGQARIEYALHSRVLLEPARDRERGLVLALHAERQGLQAPDEEERAERIEHSPENAAQVLDRLDQPGAAADGAGEQVVVAAQVLGAGMDHQIGAQRDRALVHRGGEGAVDDQVRSGAGVARAGEQREIRHAQVGVGGRLREDHLGPTRAERSAQPGLVAGLYERRFHAEPDEEAGDELAGAPIAVAGEDDVIAGLEQLEQGGGRGGHAAREEGGAFRALERGDLLLRRAHGGIPVPPVLLALEVAGEVPLDLRGVGEPVGGGEDDRRSDGVVGLPAWLAAMDGERRPVRFGGSGVCHRGQPFHPPRWLKNPAA